MLEFFTVASAGLLLFEGLGLIAQGIFGLEIHKNRTPQFMRTMNVLDGIGLLIIAYVLYLNSPYA